MAGAAPAVWMRGQLLVLVYFAFVFEPHEVFEIIVAKLLSLPRDTPWITGGDFNAILQERPFRRVFGSDNFETLATGLPTRWNGIRCVDYFLSAQFHDAPTTPDVWIADRKVQALKLQVQVPRHARVAMAPSPRLPPYQGRVES